MRWPARFALLAVSSPLVGLLSVGAGADGVRRAVDSAPVLVARAAHCPPPAAPAGGVTTVTADHLREAIALAAPGAEIQVAGGVLAGALDVDRPVRLLGVGRPVIDGRNAGTVVRLLAPGILLSGFVVRRSGASLLNDDASILVTANDVTVADVDVQEGLHGIYVLRAQRFRLLRNRIRGKPWINDENRGNGIHLHGASDGVIEGNDVATVRDGVYFNYSDRNLIAGNRARDLRYGLHYMWSHDNRFLDNEFTESVGGAALMYSHGIVFERNTFARHRGFRAHGVLFKDVDHCRAIGNRMLDNTEGITLDGAVGNRFEANLVAGNDAAVVEYGNSEDNVFTGNAFVGNGADLREVGQRSSSRWEEGGRGNYWSGYDGFDLNGDGLGDAPYRLQDLFEYLEGERPVLRVLAHGPGAAAVRMAERAFPVLRQRDTVDPRPLMRVPDSITRANSPSGRGSGTLGIAAASAVLCGLALVLAGRRSPSRPPGFGDARGFPLRRRRT